MSMGDYPYREPKLSPPPSETTESPSTSDTGEEDKKLTALQKKEELRKKQAEAIQRKKDLEGVEEQESAPVQKEKETPTVTTPSQPSKPKPKVLRKEQIDNAVRFLTHPKVKSSPLGKRIAFLEHKGLNDDEISEALKLANVSAEEIKAAQAQQDAQNEETEINSTSETPSAPAYEPRKGPQLPARPAMPVPVQPPPSQWKSQALTALLCFGVGTATSLLAAKYIFAPGGLLSQKGEKPSEGTGAEKKKKKKKKTKKKAIKKEIDTLRSNQEELNKEMKEAVSSMQALLELQSKAATLPSRSPSLLSRSVPSSSSVGDGKAEELESLKAEVKALRARMLDQQTSGSNIAKSVVAGRTEKPLVTIPPTTVTAEGSALPSWMINSQPLKKSAPTTTTTTTTTSSPSSTPPSSPESADSSAVPPTLISASGPGLNTQTPTHDGQPQGEVEQSKPVVTTTTTTTTTSSPLPDSGKNVSSEQSSGQTSTKRERPPKPYQNKQKASGPLRSPPTHRGVGANGDAMEENQVGKVDSHHNINENEDDENDGEAAENENVKMQHAADNLEENRSV